MSLLCGICEKPLQGHNDGACRRKLSRRHFFLGLFGAAAALALPKRVPTGGLFNPKADIVGQWRSDIQIVRSIEFNYSATELEIFRDRYIAPAALAPANSIDRQLLIKGRMLPDLILAMGDRR